MRKITHSGAVICVVDIPVDVVGAKLLWVQSSRHSIRCASYCRQVMALQ